MQNNKNAFNLFYFNLILGGGINKKKELHFDVQYGLLDSGGVTQQNVVSNMGVVVNIYV